MYGPSHHPNIGGKGPNGREGDPDNQKEDKIGRMQIGKRCPRGGPPPQEHENMGVALVTPDCKDQNVISMERNVRADRWSERVGGGQDHSSSSTEKNDSGALSNHN